MYLLLVCVKFEKEYEKSDEFVDTETYSPYNNPGSEVSD